MSPAGTWVPVTQEEMEKAKAQFPHLEGEALRRAVERSAAVEKYGPAGGLAQLGGQFFGGMAAARKLLLGSKDPETGEVTLGFFAQRTADKKQREIDEKTALAEIYQVGGPEALAQYGYELDPSKRYKPYATSPMTAEESWEEARRTGVTPQGVPIEAFGQTQARGEAFEQDLGVPTRQWREGEQGYQPLNDEEMGNLTTILQATFPLLAEEGMFNEVSPIVLRLGMDPGSEWPAGVDPTRHPGGPTDRFLSGNFVPMFRKITGKPGPATLPGGIPIYLAIPVVGGAVDTYHMFGGSSSEFSFNMEAFKAELGDDFGDYLWFTARLGANLLDVAPGVGLALARGVPWATRGLYSGGIGHEAKAMRAARSIALANREARGGVTKIRGLQDWIQYRKEIRAIREGGAQATQITGAHDLRNAVENSRWKPNYSSSGRLVSTTFKFELPQQVHIAGDVAGTHMPAGGWTGVEEHAYASIVQATDGGAYTAIIHGGGPSLEVGRFNTWNEARDAVSRMGDDPLQWQSALQHNVSKVTANASEPLSEAAEAQLKKQSDVLQGDPDVLVREMDPNVTIKHDGTLSIEEQRLVQSTQNVLKSIEAYQPRVVEIARAAAANAEIATANFTREMSTNALFKNWLKTSWGRVQVRNQKLDQMIFDIMDGKKVTAGNAVEEKLLAEAQEIVPVMRDLYTQTGIQLKMQVPHLKDMQILDNYITHIPDDTLVDLMTTYGRAHAVQKGLPQKMYFPFSRHREHATELLKNRSAWESINAYHTTAHRVIHMQPALGQVNRIIESIDDPKTEQILKAIQHLLSGQGSMPGYATTGNGLIKGFIEAIYRKPLAFAGGKLIERLPDRFPRGVPQLPGQKQGKRVGTIMTRKEFEAMGITDEDTLVRLESIFRHGKSWTHKETEALYMLMNSEQETVKSVAMAMGNMYRALLYGSVPTAMDQLTQFIFSASDIGAVATLRGVGIMTRAALTKEGIAAAAKSISEERFSYTMLGAGSGAAVGGAFAGPLGAAVNAAISPVSRAGKAAMFAGLQKHAPNVFARLGVTGTDINMLRGPEIVAFTTNILRGLDATGFSQLDMMETLLRGATFFGALDRGARMGFEGLELQRFAINVVDRTQFTYDMFSRNPWFKQSIIGRILSPLTSFPMKHARFIRRMMTTGAADGSDPGHALARYLFYNGLAYHAASEFFKTMGAEGSYTPRAVRPLLRIPGPGGANIPMTPGFETMQGVIGIAGSTTRGPGASLFQALNKAMEDSPEYGPKFMWEFTKSFLWFARTGGGQAQYLTRTTPHTNPQTGEPVYYIQRNESLPAQFAAGATGLDWSDPKNYLSNYLDMFQGKIGTGAAVRITTKERELFRMFGFVDAQHDFRTELDRRVMSEWADISLKTEVTDKIISIVRGAPTEDPFLALDPFPKQLVQRGLLSEDAYNVQTMVLDGNGNPHVIPIGEYGEWVPSNPSDPRSPGYWKDRGTEEPLPFPRRFVGGTPGEGDTWPPTISKSALARIVNVLESEYGVMWRAQEGIFGMGDWFQDYTDIFDSDYRAQMKFKIPIWVVTKDIAPHVWENPALMSREQQQEQIIRSQPALEVKDGRVLNSIKVEKAHSYNEKTGAWDLVDVSEGMKVSFNPQILGMIERAMRENTQTFNERAFEGIPRVARAALEEGLAAAAVANVEKLSASMEFWLELGQDMRSWNDAVELYVRAMEDSLAGGGGGLEDTQGRVRKWIWWHMEQAESQIRKNREQ